MSQLLWLLSGAVILLIGVVFGAALASHNKAKDGFAELAKILTETKLHKEACPHCGYAVLSMESANHALDEISHHIRIRHDEYRVKTNV